MNLNKIIKHFFMENDYHLMAAKTAVVRSDGIVLFSNSNSFEESSSIVVIPTITDIDCNNPDGGQVNFEISGGLPPYNFKLFLIDPDTEAQIDYGTREDITNFFNLRGLEAGNYILEVRDQGINCVKQKEFEIKKTSPDKFSPVAPVP